MTTLVRAAPTLRAVREDDGETLFGSLPLDQWAEIDSLWEGTFLERIAPGAFERTFREDRIVLLFEHGRDPVVGNKPLGTLRVLREERDAAVFEGDLFRTSYNADLVPALEAGAYGASFRFEVLREAWVAEPERSEHNPGALPERTLQEVRVFELGPVTFPAYEGSSAGVRSLTDVFA